MGGIMKAISTLLRKNTTNAASQSGARVPIVIDKTVDNESISAINGSASMSELMQVLGGIDSSLYNQNFDLDTFDQSGIFFMAKAKCDNAPSPVNDGIFISHYGTRPLQIWVSTALGTNYGMFIRIKNTTWGNWYRFTLT